jgi:hypothetical protein
VRELKKITFMVIFCKHCKHELNVALYMCAGRENLLNSVLYVILILTGFEVFTGVTMKSTVLWM